GFGAAAQARAEPVGNCRLGTGIKLHIHALWRDGGAYRTAENPGGQNGGVKPTVKPAIPGL
ncbi:hypothetical protein TH5_24945, partial [Thalassospira xianhensis MCCC 1A02616]